MHCDLFLRSFLKVVRISLMAVLGFYPSCSDNGFVLSCCCFSPLTWSVLSALQSAFLVGIYLYGHFFVVWFSLHSVILLTFFNWQVFSVNFRNGPTDHSHRQSHLCLLIWQGLKVI